ncbi:ribosome 60S biogenesis N-terminal-domain-containing protein [Crucibulum laeve]|uniref:Ribosome 60S biogenesis N-terminal-domain-containing protein n=1 Tax=Crucibulum laeve TaxID=68775 RepID=A0A5C3LKM6_9AGAR|nr:ribosome 60S biogenesis N-terminal-domain-containing protein [Crucibulum laeve]
MPPKTAFRGPEPPSKRLKLDNSVKKAAKFSTVEDIRNALRAQNADALVEGLTALRNQLNVRGEESIISPQDERLLLVQHWMENSPGAYDVFGIWDSANSRQSSLLAVIVSLFSSILTLLSSHYTHHALGQPIIKTLLNPQYMRKLNSYIGGSSNELILVTLKLFNVMAAFAGGKERKSVLEGFGWEIRSLPKLLNMRRKTKGDDIDPLLKPDIRTLYILLILSFVDFDSTTQTKTAFLEQHRDAFLAIFKGLIQDHYSVIRKILEVCWAGIWSDQKVKRTLKIGLFNETTIAHLMKLYDRVASEDDEDDHIPADLVHHFLLAICTRSGTGICFKDRGWYPRETDTDDRAPKNDDAVSGRGGKIYNKILANVLKTLKVNEDSRQQELALKIISACPELVAGYWSGAALTLEPRLSSKWIANISFFGAILSLPIPTSSFFLPNSALYQPTPPPLSTILENILPTVNTKAHFSKGLQSSSGLVQHCSALALAKCLNKYTQVASLFRTIATALEEDEENGQWFKRLVDLEREVRKRVPDFQVIVAFSQQKFGEVPGKPISSPPTPNPTRAALLAESAQRLLRMYHQCLPAVVAEARFDVGKLLLQGFSEDDKDKEEGDDQDQEPDAATRLGRVRQLHVLQLLKESDHFIWAGKAGSSTHTYFYIMLKGLAAVDIPATRVALTQLLKHILSKSIIFQDDGDEPDLWLSSLPRTKRGPGAESLDGALLTDEAESVITFLDDCVQRCLKTPYKYIEELYTLNGSNAGQTQDSTDRLDTYPSPLLMTVLEQLDAKLKHSILSPSDVLALASFLRKLVFRLSTKLQDLQPLRIVAEKVDSILQVDRLYKQYPVMTGAIRREVGMMKRNLCFLQPSPQETMISAEVKSFLDQVEQIPTPGSAKARCMAAYELVDWLRLVNLPLGVDEIKRLSVVVKNFDAPTLRDIADNLEPIEGLLWEGLDASSAEIRQHLTFEPLYAHAGEKEIVDESCRHAMSQALFAYNPVFVEVKRAVRGVLHGLSVSASNSRITNGLLLLLASILKTAGVALPPTDFNSLKGIVFVRPGPLKDGMMSQSLADGASEGLNQLVDVTLNASNQADRKIASDIARHWLNVLKMSMETEVSSQLISASIWIKYLEQKDLFDLMDRLSASADDMPSFSVLELLRVVLSATALLAKSQQGSDVPLRQRLPQLLALRSILPEYVVLEDMIAVAVETALPVCCDGSPLRSGNFDDTSIVPVVHRALNRWSRHLDPLLTTLQIRQFLTQKTWSSSTVKIISGLLYRGSFSIPAFLSWMTTIDCTQRDIEQIVPVVHAFLDTSRCVDRPTSDLVSDAWLSQITRLMKVVTDEDRPQVIRVVAASCVSLILELVPSQRSTHLAPIVEEVNSLPLSSMTAEGVIIGIRLHKLSPSNSKVLVEALTDRGLQWATRQFADDEGIVFTPVVDQLTVLVELGHSAKAHLVETLIGAVIQNRLSSVAAVKLATASLSTVSLKPVTVNRHLQSIVQHPHLFKICANANAETLVIRDAIIDLLHVLFNLHPTNTCQVTHVEPLARVYRGTLSTSDLKILSIFQLFESQRKTSVVPLLCRWSSSLTLSSSTSLEAIQSVEPILVLRTCLNFPKWRTLEDQSKRKVSAQDAQLYDPVFLILLFGQMLSECPPESAFAWIELFRTNIVSLFLRALSAKDGKLRDVALCQIAALWKQLEFADLQEKPHVVHILTLLKDVLPPPSHEPPRRLPAYSTLILLHALRGIFYPSNFIYPLTARFLLQRPELDTGDVPMLYGMLYSSTDDWKKERGWIIRFLSDGMMSSEDWRVFKRRHTWDLLASLFQSSENDNALRHGVLEVLATLTSNSQATTSLILKSALLAWIEMQLRQSTKEAVAWVKIMDNIMIAVEASKLELSTHGEWRAIICRCLSIILDKISDADSLAIFPLLAPTMLRLSSLSGTPIPGLSGLLEQSLVPLQSLEATVALPRLGEVVTFSKTVVVPITPHFSYGLHDPPVIEDPLAIWGSSVEMLWRVAMSVEEKSDTWDALTSRVLVWRAVTGSASAVGEWARTETVRNMLI